MRHSQASFDDLRRLPTGDCLSCHAFYGVLLLVGQVAHGSPWPRNQPVWAGIMWQTVLRSSGSSCPGTRPITTPSQVCHAAVTQAKTLASSHGQDMPHPASWATEALPLNKHLGSLRGAFTISACPWHGRRQGRSWPGAADGPSCRRRPPASPTAASATSALQPKTPWRGDTDASEFHASGYQSSQHFRLYHIHHRAPTTNGPLLCAGGNASRALFQKLD